MPGKGDRFYMLLGFRLMKPKHAIVGMCGLGVHLDNEVCRICAGCGECPEIPLEGVMVRGFFVRSMSAFGSIISKRCASIEVNKTYAETLRFNTFVRMIQFMLTHDLYRSLS